MVFNIIYAYFWTVPNYWLRLSTSEAYQWDPIGSDLRMPKVKDGEILLEA